MFLLVEEDTDKYYKNTSIKLGTGLATTKYLPLKPRIVEITREASGYGFFLKADPKTPGRHASKEWNTFLASLIYPSFQI